MKRQKPRPSSINTRAVTLIELLVVVLIIGILSTIATNVYTGQVLRARKSATLDMIREISVAATRYEIDNGELPLSGSGTFGAASIPGGPLTIASRVPNVGISGLLQPGTDRAGNGFLYFELTKSMNGSPYAPYPKTWQGPYLEFASERLLQVDPVTGTQLPAGQVQLLDAFSQPFEYVNFREYSGASQGTHLGLTGIPAPTNVRGTLLFNNNKPFSAQAELPAVNPFAATETYYNPTTFQIYSVGVNGVTYDAATPPTDDPGANYGGTEGDDINNFGY